MYHKGYGIIETLAPLHVGASAGEETGNLNLIFRDQFTKTGIIPGSSIRGRLRSQMRMIRQQWLEQEVKKKNVEIPKIFILINKEGKEEKCSKLEWLEHKAEELKIDVPPEKNENLWYGHEATKGQDGGTTEAIVKFEYASLVWFPVFCPGQPIVWITCPRLLQRFKLITGMEEKIPDPYTASKTLQGRQLKTQKPVLFFNLGFMEIEQQADLDKWIPVGANIPSSNLVVVDNNDVAMLHDMGLYRQSRVKLLDDVKKVDTDKGAFFNVEALPEGSILGFPIATKESGWKNALKTGDKSWKEAEPETVQKDLYFGGLESIGFGRCQVTIAGDC